MDAAVLERGRALRIRETFRARPCYEFMSGHTVRLLIDLGVDPLQLSSARGADLETIYDGSTPEIRSVLYEAVSLYQPTALLNAPAENG